MVGFGGFGLDKFCEFLMSCGARSRPQLDCLFQHGEFEAAFGA